MNPCLVYNQFSQKVNCSFITSLPNIDQKSATVTKIIWFVINLAKFDSNVGRIHYVISTNFWLNRSPYICLVVVKNVNKWLSWLICLQFRLLKTSGMSSWTWWIKSNWCNFVFPLREPISSHWLRENQKKKR